MTEVRRSQAIGLLGGSVFALAPLRTSAQSAPVRFGYVPVDSGLQPLFAQEQGFFERAGVAVDVVPFSNPAAVLQAVAGNALELGQADIMQLAQAGQHGVPFSIIAGAALYSSENPTSLLCVAKDSPYKTAKDLEGQTFGTVALNTPITLAARAWFDANGVDSTKIKEFELPFPQMAPALQRGTIASALIVEPFLTFARNDLRPIGKPLDMIAKSYCITGTYGTRDWAARNGPLVRRLQSALYAAASWANGHQPETLQSLVKAANMDIDRIRGMNRALWATSLNPSLFQPILDLAVKYRYLEGPLRATDFFVKPA